MLKGTIGRTGAQYEHNFIPISQCSRILSSHNDINQNKYERNSHEIIHSIQTYEKMCLCSTIFTDKTVKRGFI